MAQSYFPMRTHPGSPLSVEELVGSEKQSKVEDVQEAYIEHKNRLVDAIDSTKSILGDLREFNKDAWVVRYPHLRETNSSTPPPVRPGKGLRRSLSFADDPSYEADVVVSHGLNRSVTLASIHDAEDEVDSIHKSDDTDRLIPSSNAADFHVLRLDLKLGSHGSSNSPTALVSQLEKASIANLLDDRLKSSMEHTDKLRARIEDKSSKVLVTGDLNAGKSTFVNALLKRELMPVDQQPCTTAFCEVHDATENGGKEEVHVVKEGQTYSVADETTFTRVDISNLDTVISENENVQQVVKLYVADTREPAQSLLNNGVVDISLIDAPGLNRDSIKTTALFARQEEIDVVVFVVSAENHFTLSAKEFLWNASNEKAYLFIVVNKYEQIRDKAKCRRLVLEQIKQLSPRTYEDAEDLVHFVDSSAVLGSSNSSFDKLESALRSFVLVKRSKSKLNPVSTYLCHLLSDIDLLAGANAIVAQTELERARQDLERARPILEKMKEGREGLEDGLESVEEEGAGKASTRTKERLINALEKVGQGQLGVDKPLIPMPSYPGFLGIWDYARDVKKALLASLDFAVKLAEDEARITTSTGVDAISQMGDKHLPEGVERSRRVFMPEAMFSLRGGKGGRSSRRISSTVVAGGIHGLGIGLAQRPEMLDISFFDLFDVQHHFSVHFGSGKESLDEDESSASALSVVSIGLGALTMVGGRTLGARGIIEGVMRISDLMGNETARKWAAPVVGAFTLGLTVYFVLELPRTIPKTVGRRIRASLLKANEGESEDLLFVNAHAMRVSRETRKVLRLASWDLRERFRAAMDERGREVKGAEESEKRSSRAVEWFRQVEKRTGEVRSAAGLMEIA